MRTNILRHKPKWLIPAAAIATAAAVAGIKFYSESQFRYETSRLAETLELKPGMIVADIGAGEGKWTAAVASRVGPGGHVFSTELDPKRIEKIRRAVRKAGLANVTVVAAGPQETGLLENCCDAIFLRGVYHHLTQPAAINQSLWKALRPGGLLVVIDFPPKLLLWPWRPKGVPNNRGGHGIPQRVLIDELGREDFDMKAIISDWPGGRYCVLFRKPTQILSQL